MASPDSAFPPSTQTDALFAMLYGELRRLAQREWARAGPDVPLSATTLLHEAYIDMSRREALAFPDMPRFLAYAARAMRSIIIDRAREVRSLKRGGDLDITSFDTENAQDFAEPEQPHGHRPGARRALVDRSGAGAGRRPQVLLRLRDGGDRRPARRLGADHPSPVGQGEDLALPRHAVGRLSDRTPLAQADQG